MPTLPTPPTPRIILYHQTHHTPTGTPISLLPLLNPTPSITHLIIAALHLNDPPGTITLNDHPPSHPRNTTLWSELPHLQRSGIKVLFMLGGAAIGTFTRLDLSPTVFEMYYEPLRDLIRERGVDGVDLDVEEPMTLQGVVRLIDRLRGDFGRGLLITLAPVARALAGGVGLSGFGYGELEAVRGREIAWYNTQFYCGWGDAGSVKDYERCIEAGFEPGKVVLGMVTCPENGAGWVGKEIVREVLISLRAKYGEGFGGVMGWEYFNSRIGDGEGEGAEEGPWEWARFMSETLRGGVVDGREDGVVGAGRVGEARQL